jgi:hypothetical protein
MLSMGSLLGPYPLKRPIGNPSADGNNRSVGRSGRQLSAVASAGGSESAGLDALREEVAARLGALESLLQAALANGNGAGEGGGVGVRPCRALWFRRVIIVIISIVSAIHRAMITIGMLW